jgi:hypothetical protein
MPVRRRVDGRPSRRPSAERGSSTSRPCRASRP